MPARTREPISQCACMGGSLACGSVSTYRAGCGCDNCRASHAARIKANTHRRKEASGVRRATPELTKGIADNAFISGAKDRPKSRAHRRDSTSSVVVPLNNWRPRGHAPIDPSFRGAGPAWRERNLGAWCMTHCDWTQREGSDHTKGECKLKDGLVV